MVLGTTLFTVQKEDRPLLLTTQDVNINGALLG